MPAARIYKTIILTAISLCLACSLAFAADVTGTAGATTATATSATTELEQLTLAQTIELALTNSSTVALQDLAVKEAELNLKTAQVNLNITYTVKQLEDAQAALEAAKAQVELSKAAQALAAAERYISVLKAEHTLTLANAGVEQAGRQQSLVQERYGADMATETDLYNADSNLRRAQLTQRQAVAALESEQIQFNQLTGRDLLAPFLLVDELTQEVPAWEMERDIAQALSSRLDIQVLRKNLELTERNLSLADPRYTSQAQIERLKMAQERSAITLQQAEIKVMLEVRSAIVALETALINAELANDALMQQKKQLQVATLRHDSGLITLSEFMDAQVEANTKEVQAVQAVYDVELAVARYLNAIGTGYTSKK